MTEQNLQPLDPRTFSRPPASKRRVAVAMTIAILADAAQWIWLPLTAMGAISPLNDGIDVAVAVCMIALLGWHWQFLPAFFGELLPIFDLVPTWTLAVWLATRTRPPRQDADR